MLLCVSNIWILILSKHKYILYSNNAGCRVYVKKSNGAGLIVITHLEIMVLMAVMGKLKHSSLTFSVLVVLGGVPEFVGKYCRGSFVDSTKQVVDK